MEHFMVLVVGDNHEELIGQYSKAANNEPHVIYKFSDVKKYRNNYINGYKTVLKQLLDNNASQEEINTIQMIINDYESMSDIDFFCDLASDYEIDSETGNAISYENDNAKYDYAVVDKYLSYQMVTKDGKSVYSARKKDLDFSKFHLTNTLPYEVAWETVVDGREPINDNEKKIFDNMKRYPNYFSNFKDKEHYVKSSTSFWCYAYLDQNGWIEIGDNDNQFEWVTEFYDRFIKKLNDDDLITIYDCVKK